MKKSQKSNYLYLVMAILLSMVSKVMAADLQVSPANSYVRIDGGEEKWLNYQLTNESQQDLVISLEAKSFLPDENFGQPILQPELLFPYLTLHEGTESATPQVLLPANSSKQVQVKAAPPLGVAKREYPLTLLFVAESANQTGPSNTRVSFNLGSNLIVQTDKSNTDQSQLTLVEPELPPLVDSLVPLSRQVRVLNQGASSTLISGEVVLKRKDGTVVAKWELYPDLVLGKSARLARGKTAPDGNGHVSLISDLPFSWPLLGEYIFEGEVVSSYPGTAQAPTKFQIKFLALPYYLLGGVLLVIVVAFWLVKRSKKSTARANLRAKAVQMQRQKNYFE